MEGEIMADTAYGHDDAMFSRKVPTDESFKAIADVISAVEVVTALPADASSHPKTLYVIKE